MTFDPKYHAVIKGWDALDRFCERRFQERPRFCEHFAHLSGCDIERIDCVKSPTDKYYEYYFFLALRTQDNRSTLDNEASDYIREGIRNGTIKLLQA